MLSDEGSIAPLILLESSAMAASSNQQAAQLQHLQDEEIGVRYRMQHFYLPLFRDFCLAKQLNPGQVRVLDCGCGNGLSVECLAEAGLWAFGIDAWTLRYRQWKERRRLERAKFCQADATRLPFADSSFDIVFSCGLLEHIGVFEEIRIDYEITPLPDQASLRQRFLAECLRVLRPGGLLYIDHPNGAFPIDFWHNHYNRSGRARFHWPWEKFLPTLKEVVTLAHAVDPDCRVEAISPAGRFTFRRSTRRWYGKLFARPLELYFELLRYFPFSLLAGSPLNPYLVIRITRP